MPSRPFDPELELQEAVAAASLDDALRLMLEQQLQPFFGDLTICFVIGGQPVAERYSPDRDEAVKRATLRAAMAKWAHARGAAVSDPPRQVDLNELRSRLRRIADQASRTNRSGCACKLDPETGAVLDPCAAHLEWLRARTEHASRRTPAKS